MKQKARSRKGKSRTRINPRPRFSEKRLTNRAGLIPISRFIDQLAIEDIIDRTVSIVRASNADKGVGLIFKAIMLGVMSGYRHPADIVRWV